MSDEKRDYAVDEKRDITYQPPPQPKINVPSPTSSVANNPVLPILSYCASSILMTVTNKYVLSGRDFNLNFMLLAVQASLSSCRLLLSPRPLTTILVYCLRRGNPDMQIRRRHLIQGLQQRRS